MVEFGTSYLSGDGLGLGFSVLGYNIWSEGRGN